MFPRLRSLTANGYALMQGASPNDRSLVGWTNPTIIYDSMRRIDADANQLDALVRAHVRDQSFLASWDAWYTGQWRPFFARYQTPGLAGDPGRWGALLSTDALARDVETQSQRLRGFVEDYNHLRGAGPPARVPGLEQPLVVDDQKSGGGFTLPWWAWMLGGVAVVGVGYWLYTRYQAAQQAKGVIYREVLPPMIGPGLSRAAERANRDSERLEGGMRISRRDPDAGALPSLADFAADPRAATPVVYRPYEHPHVVPYSVHTPTSDYDREGDSGYDPYGWSTMSDDEIAGVYDADDDD